MNKCSHISQVTDQETKELVCEDCVKTGDSWVHLRTCLTCGHVGCCDSSKNKHATKHYRSTKHPVVKSAQPGEEWGWCYADELMFDLSRGVAHARVVSY